VLANEYDEWIRVHLRFQIGAPSRVFEDLYPDLIALNLYPVPPSVIRPWWMLVTSGMSSAPMRVRRPGRREKLVHAELSMLLPPDWPMGDPEADEDHWPLSLLGDIARLPHAHDTWLSPGDVVANGSPPAPYAAKAPFAGAILVPPKQPGWRFSRFNVSKTVAIEFLAVIPIMPDEIELAREVGGRRLRRMLARGGVNELFDPERKSIRSSGLGG
jgi:hypothetical protein